MALPPAATTSLDISENTEIISLHRVHKKAVRRPVLIVLEGSQLERLHLLAGGTTTMGRDPACEIALPDSTCSRRHAQITLEWVGGQAVVTLTDLGSTNGTLLNGERIEGSRQLREHDKFRVGASQFIFQTRDEQELAREQRLVELATTDQLTGLLNRGAFDRELAREFERCRRYARAMALLLFDIDHFKHVNDTYGHPTGDHVLKQVGKVVQASLRACDHPGRYGGEEFAVVFVETGPDGAWAAAERIRRAVARQRFVADEDEFSVTVSGGLVIRGEAYTRLEDLVRAADKALYAAKAGGRDKLVLAEPA